MKPGGFWEARNAGRHSERRGKRGVGGNVASRLLGFSRVPTLLGPGRLHTGRRSDTSSGPRHRTRDRTSKRMLLPGTGDLWRPVYEARRRVPRKWPREPRRPGQVRWDRARSAEGEGPAVPPAGWRATGDPAGEAAARARGAAGGRTGARAEGGAWGSCALRAPLPQRGSRRGPGPGASGRRSCGFTGHLGRSAAPREAADGAGCLSQRAGGARAALGPWSLVTRHASARSGWFGRCHRGCCCCRCSRCCWVGGCARRPRPPPLGRRPRTAALWRSSPRRRRRRRATGRTA